MPDATDAILRSINGSIVQLHEQLKEQKVATEQTNAILRKLLEGQTRLIDLLEQQRQTPSADS